MNILFSIAAVVVALGGAFFGVMLPEQPNEMDIAERWLADQEQLAESVYDQVRSELRTEFDAKLQASETRLGATIPVVVAAFETSLQARIESTDTSMTLVTGTDAAGSALDGYMCFTLDEGTSIEEFVCGTASSTSVTSMIRGIDPVDGDLEVAALKQVHRRGASVKVTNHPALTIALRLLNGDEGLPNLIKYASDLTPTSNEHLASKSYVDAAALGGALAQDRVVVEATAGETVADGDLVLLDVDDGEWYLATSASSSESVHLGVAQSAGTDGAAITSGVLIMGKDNAQSGGTAGGLAYASSTAGTIFTSADTTEKVVGQFLSATEIYFNPGFYYLVTANQKDALAGTSGTPSSSNKFVTNDDTAESGISIVVRSKADGQITASSTPSSTTDAASKNYVDLATVQVAVGNFTANDTATTSIAIGFDPLVITFSPYHEDDAAAAAMAWCTGFAVGSAAEDQTCGTTTDRVFFGQTAVSESVSGKVTTFASSTIVSMTETGTASIPVSWMAIGFPSE